MSLTEYFFTENVNENRFCLQKSDFFELGVFTMCGWGYLKHEYSLSRPNKYISV